MCALFIRQYLSWFQIVILFAKELKLVIYNRNFFLIQVNSVFNQIGYKTEKQNIFYLKKFNCL